MSLVIQGLEVGNIFYRYLIDKVNSKTSCDSHLSESTQATTPPPPKSCSSRVMFSPDFSNDWTPKLEIMRRKNSHPSPKPHQSLKRSRDQPAADSGGAPINRRRNEQEGWENRMERLEEAEENEGDERQDAEENVPNGAGGGGENGGDENENNNNNNEENEEDDDIMPMEEGEMVRTVARIRHVYGLHRDLFLAEILFAFLDVYEDRIDQIQADIGRRLTEIEQFKILVEMYSYLHKSRMYRRYETFPWRAPASFLNNRNGPGANHFPTLHIVFAVLVTEKMIENRDRD